MSDKNFANAYYYALHLAGDLKLNSQWTRNIFEVRYRNAFEYTWITEGRNRPGSGEWSLNNFAPAAMVVTLEKYGWRTNRRQGQCRSRFARTGSDCRKGALPLSGDVLRSEVTSVIPVSNCVCASRSPVTP